MPPPALVTFLRCAFPPAAAHTKVTRARCTAQHCTALRCTALHCSALHCAALHCTALHCTALDRTDWIHHDLTPYSSACCLFWSACLPRCVLVPRPPLGSLPPTPHSRPWRSPARRSQRLRGQWPSSCCRSPSQRPEREVKGKAEGRAGGRVPRGRVLPHCCAGYRGLSLGLRSDMKHAAGYIVTCRTCSTV